MFIDKYQEGLNLGKRFDSMKQALGFFNGQIIVETGTTRMQDDWGGGMSTLVFADFCKQNNKHLFTVDNSPEAIKCAKDITKEFEVYITYVVNDSLDFLSKFDQKIDLLYLDSMDCPQYDSEYSPNLIASQIHQLKEIQMAWDKLTPSSIVLLDDNDFENGGKTRLTKYFLRDKNYKEVYSGKQSLWIPNN